MKNQKGITLVEVLAALSILLIISSVIYGVLISSKRNYNNISERVNLNQEANLILATMKNYHQKESLHSLDVNSKEYYLIKYDDSQHVYIGKSSTDLIPLQKEGLSMNIKIDEVEFTGEKVIYPSEALTIYIKVFNQKGQSYEINTVIKQY
ncbi:prepilin-type N-terminal cleavage/methylation domain-containing protein [Neobacillus drentensis]|uniref:PilW family protein n=1 Tax=Neobacillus drentensis TaxID=220684 RepID=UPI002FFFD6C2